MCSWQEKAARESLQTLSKCWVWKRRTIISPPEELKAENPVFWAPNPDGCCAMLPNDGGAVFWLAILPNVGALGGEANLQNRNMWMNAMHASINTVNQKRRPLCPNARAFILVSYAVEHRCLHTRTRSYRIRLQQTRESTLTFDLNMTDSIWVTRRLSSHHTHTFTWSNTSAQQTHKHRLSLYNPPFSITTLNQKNNPTFHLISQRFQTSATTRDVFMWFSDETWINNFMNNWI